MPNNNQTQPDFRNLPEMAGFVSPAPIAEAMFPEGITTTAVAPYEEMMKEEQSRVEAERERIRSLYEPEMEEEKAKAAGREARGLKTLATYRGGLGGVSWAGKQFLDDIQATNLKRGKELTNALNNALSIADEKSATTLRDLQIKNFESQIMLEDRQRDLLDKMIGYGFKLGEAEMKEAELMGTYKGMPTIAAQQLSFEKQQAELNQKIQQAQLLGDFEGIRTLQGKQLDLAKQQQTFQQQISIEELGINKADLALRQDANKRAESQQQFEQDRDTLALQLSIPEGESYTLQSGVVITGLKNETKELFNNLIKTNPELVALSGIEKGDTIQDTLSKIRVSLSAQKTLDDEKIRAEIERIEAETKLARAQSTALSMQQQENAGETYIITNPQTGQEVQMSPLAHSIWSGTGKLDDLTNTDKAKVLPELDRAGYKQHITAEIKDSIGDIKTGLEKSLALLEEVPNDYRGYFQGNITTFLKREGQNSQVQAFTTAQKVVGMKIARLFEKGRMSDQDRDFYLSLMPNLAMKNDQIASDAADELIKRLNDLVEYNIKEFDNAKEGLPSDPLGIE